VFGSGLPAVAGKNEENLLFLVVLLPFYPGPMFGFSQNPGIMPAAPVSGTRALRF